MIWDAPPPLDYDKASVAEVIYIARNTDSENLQPIPPFSIGPKPVFRSSWPKPYRCRVLIGAKLPLVPIREIESMIMPKGFVESVKPLAGTPGQILHEFHTKDQTASLIFSCEGLVQDRKPQPLLAALLKKPPHELTKTEIRNLIMEAEDHYLPYAEKDARVRTMKWNGRTVIEQQHCLDDCSYGVVYDRRYRKTDELLRMEITFRAPKKVFEERLPEIKACLKSLKWSKHIAPQ